MNPAGRHFSRIRANDLLLLDSAATPTDDIDPTGVVFTRLFTRHVPAARCILHTHAPYVTALASLADWRMPMCDQNACRFFNRVAYDDSFGGMLLAEEEAARQAAALGDKKVLVMRGHGVMTIGDDVAEAFDVMYYFERSCKNQWLAMAANRPLYAVTDEIAEKTARQWNITLINLATLPKLRAILDAEEPEYAELGRKRPKIPE